MPVRGAVVIAAGMPTTTSHGANTLVYAVALVRVVAVPISAPEQMVMFAAWGDVLPVNTNTAVEANESGE